MTIKIEKATPTAAIPNTTNPKDTSAATCCQVLPRLQWRQVLESLQSVSHAIHACFLMPLNQLITGRGGAVQCNSGLSVKAARRSLAVSNTPIVLESNQLEKTKGVSL